MTPRIFLRALVAILMTVALLYSEKAAQKISLRWWSKLPTTDGWLTFSSSMDGWLISRSDIWRTTDAGLTWRRASTIPTPQRVFPGEIDAAQFFRGGRGIVIRESRVFRTLNSGVSWDRLPMVPMGDGGEVQGIRFLADATTGWAYGAIFRPAKEDEYAPNNATRMSASGVRLVLQPIIFRTNDGGNHWIRQGLGDQMGYRVLDLALIDATHLIAVTESNAVYTDDGGSNWKRGQLFGPNCSAARTLDESEDELRSVVALNARTAWVALDDGSIYQTTNAGITWCEVLRRHTISSQFSNTPSYFRSLWFGSESLGWGVEVSGAMYETHDSGHTWLRVGPFDVRFSRLVPIDRDSGWAVAEGILYKFTAVPSVN